MLKIYAKKPPRKNWDLAKLSRYLNDAQKTFKTLLRVI